MPSKKAAISSRRGARTLRAVFALLRTPFSSTSIPGVHTNVVEASTFEKP
jgi:hypothetical protein